MCRWTAKAFLTILSVLFWAIAALLFAVGSIVFVQYRHYDDLSDAWYTLIPATILLGVGLLLILIGIVGCVGACKEQRCLLGMFFTVLIVIFAGLLISTILAFVYKQPVSDGIEKGMNDILNEYGNSTELTNQMDYIQQELTCCGIHNHSDWKNSNWYKNQNVTKHYPNSCCRNNSYCGPSSEDLFKDGCFDKVKDLLLGHLTIVAGVAGGILGVLVLGMIFACVLMCNKKDVPYSILTNDGGMRV